VLELITSIEDAHLTLQFHRPTDNICIEDITHASQSNNAFTYGEHLNLQLNRAARMFQTISMDEKMMKYTELFRKAPDAVHVTMLQDMEHGIDKLNQEEHNLGAIQDPPKMSGRHMRGKGGKCLLTAAERAERS